MKDAKKLIWLTQLGLSAAAPLVGNLWLALWLHREWGFGRWVIGAGLAVGLLGAVGGLRNTLGLLLRMEEEDKEPPAAFNEHE